MPKKLKYGDLAFLVGIALALIVGVLSGFLPPDMPPILLGILGVLGLAVGFMNIREKEVNSFLIAAIAFLAVFMSLSNILELFKALGETGLGVEVAVTGFISALVAFIAPATFIVALKAIYNIAEKE